MSMKKNKLYRGKFLIGVYALEDEGETCLALCESIDEFANYLRVSKNSATVTLHYLFTGYSKFIKSEGRLRTVSFIKIEEVD